MKKIFVYTAIVFMGIQFVGCGLLKSNKDKNIPEEKEIAIVDDTIDSDTITNLKSNTPIKNKVDKSLNGEWTLVTLFGKKITLAEAPFLNFEIKQNIVYGNSGCNVINGSFITGNNKELSFENVITTMMTCPDTKVEVSFLKAMNETTHYSFATLKGFTYLNLMDKRGSHIMSLKRHNLNVLNGAWTVQEIAGVHTEDEKVKLVIDIQELKIHGNSGCNIINGQVVLDPMKDNSVQFAQIGSTRMACPDMKTETALLVALEEVEFYKKHNSNQIEFYNNKGVKVLILRRLNLK